MMPPRVTVPEGLKPADRLAKMITIVAAGIAASVVGCGFLAAMESGRANSENRAGVLAHNLASERALQVGRIADADYDYIAGAELGAFRASEFEARGLVQEADIERATSVYLLQSTYCYTDGYYTDAELEEAVYAYDTVGFTQVWSAYTTYADDLQAQVDAERAAADAHLQAGAAAGREADTLTLSVVLMGMAIALSTVALTTASSPSGGSSSSSS